MAHKMCQYLLFVPGVDTGYNKKYEKVENQDWKTCQNFSKVFLALSTSNIP